jgi:hypothetical protein
VAHGQVVFDGARIVVFDGRRAGERAASICALLRLPIVPSCILGNLISLGGDQHLEEEKSQKKISKGIVHAIPTHVDSPCLWASARFSLSSTAAAVTT